MLWIILGSNKNICCTLGLFWLVLEILVKVCTTGFPFLCVARTSIYIHRQLWLPLLCSWLMLFVLQMRHYGHDQDIRKSTQITWITFLLWSGRNSLGNWIRAQECVPYFVYLDIHLASIFCCSNFYQELFMELLHYEMPSGTL